MSDFSSRYKVENEIGRGGNGRVYKAVDIKQNKNVAVKVCLLSETSSQDGTDSSEMRSVMHELAQEAEILKSLSHPNIMKCYDVFTETNKISLILELIDGTTLDKFVINQLGSQLSLDQILDYNKVIKNVQADMSKLIKSQQTSDIRYEYHSIVRKYIQKANTNAKLAQAAQGVEAISYLDIVKKLFSQLLDVLAFMEERRVMHRDLKPENIMITKDLQLKIIDFGTAKKKAKKNDQTQVSDLVGTLGYMAPEVFLAQTDEERVYTHKVDIWAAGAILYFMLFGYNPYLNVQIQEILDFQNQYGLYLPTDLRGADYVDKFFIDVIERCFIVNHQQRASAEDLQYMFKSVTDAQSESEFKVSHPIKCIKVVLLGNLGSGKSTILKRIAQSKLTEQVAVLHRNIMWNGEWVQLELHDTLGTERRGNSMMPSIMRGTDLCMLVFKKQDQMSYDALSFWRKKLLESGQKCVFGVIAADFGGEVEFEIEKDNGMPYFELGLQSNDTEIDKMLIEMVQVCVDEECFVKKTPFVSGKKEENMLKSGESQIVANKSAGKGKCC